MTPVQLFSVVRDGGVAREMHVFRAVLALAGSNHETARFHRGIFGEKPAHQIWAAGARPARNATPLKMSGFNFYNNNPPSNSKCRHVRETVARRQTIIMSLEQASVAGNTHVGQQKQVPRQRFHVPPAISTPVSRHATAIPQQFPRQKSATPTESPSNFRASFRTRQAFPTNIPHCEKSLDRACQVF